MKNSSYPNVLVVLTALLLLAWPLCGRAQFNFITNADNTITITGYTGPGGQVTIPSMTNGYWVTTIGTNAFETQITLTGVTIPNSVTRIDEGAFFDCVSLKGATIPNSVTYIGDHAFDQCSDLTNVAIPNSVTYIGGYAFYGGGWLLASVTIGNGVTSIGLEAFGDSFALTNIDVDGTNPSYASAGGVLFNKTFTTLIQCPGGLAGSYAIPDSVTNIGNHAFDSCYSLTSVTIPNSVTSIGDGAFSACLDLTSVTIPNSVTSIGDKAFSDCAGLTNIEVAGTNPSYASAGGVLFNKTLTTLIQYPRGLAGSYAISNSVTRISDYAFWDCENLTSVTIPGSVTSIGDQAFEDCRGLTSLTTPNSVIRIGAQAFDYCIGLTSVTIPGSVTNIGAGPFSSCSGLTQISVAGTNPSYTSAGGVLFNRTLTTLIQYPGGLTGSYAIPNSVTNVGDYAFFECSGLTSVTIPDGVTIIGDYAFGFCSGLMGVTIPNGVITIGDSAFVGCSGLTGVMNLNRVTSIGNSAFGACGLTSVTIGNGVTNIGEYAFNYCPSLHQVYFEGNAPSVNGGPGSADNTVFEGDSGTVYYPPGTTGWGDTFGGWPTAVWSSPATDFTFITNNDAITITGYTGSGGNVIIPGTINTYSVTAIGTTAFLGQTNLTGVTIPNSVTRIDEGAFASCSGLTGVTIPDSVTNIGLATFQGCSGLTNVRIGNSVASIGEAAFIGCSSLTSVTIPDSVTSIGTNAFAACFDLTNIDVAAANPSYASVGGVLFDENLTTLIQFPEGLGGSYAIPNSVTSIGGHAFTSCSGLTSVTIGNSVTNIGQYVFNYCANLHQAYFEGNAPSVNGGPGGADNTVFEGDSGTVYFVPGTTGWGAKFGGWSAAPWYQARPQILGSGYGLGVGSQGFQFTISWATNAAVVVEASTNLQDWTPVSTNTLVNGTNLFGDSDWTHYPQRFYRIRVEQ